MPVNSNDRLYMAGTTGCGKTTLMKKLLKTLPRYVIHDAEWTYGECGSIVHTIEQFKVSKSQRIVFQPQNPSDIEAFDAFCREILRGKNFTLIVDEVHLYTSAAACPAGLKNLIVMGRKRGIGVWMASQRPAMTSKTCISQAEHIFVFQLTLPHDIDFFKPYLGNHADSVSTLPRYHFIHSDSRAGTLKVIDKDGNVVLSGVR